MATTADLFDEPPAPPTRDESLAAAIKRTVRYDPETGRLSHVSGRALDIYRAPDGYYVLRLAGHYTQAHRAAWLLHTGSWPTGQVDHINRKRGDNRWANLRDVTPKENAANRLTQTGDPNVRRCPEGYWEVIHKGRPEGMFLTFDEAREVAQFLRTYAT